MDDFFIESLAQPISEVIHRAIGNSFIVDYGIVKAVPADGIVTVEFSVADSKDDITITDCVLLNTASSSFAINVKPNINDKVLVLFPRKFSNDMFNVEKNETLITKGCTGYNVLSGIAILMNQFQDTHQNFIDIADGVIHLKSKNVDIQTDADSAITVTNGKATITVDKNGNVSVDAQGKYTIKNGSTDLKQVVDGLATELENLTTVGSPATQATSPASKTSIGTWRSGKLNQLFS